jgi:hypothetical protein
MKAFPSFLFVASMLLTGALVFGLSGCSQQEKKEPPPAARQTSNPEVAKASQPEQPKIGPVSVDFDKAPLSEVALFVTNHTGYGFILGGSADKPLSWIEYNIPRKKLFEAFSATLNAHGLILKQVGNAFAIDTAEQASIPYKLNFASSKRGTFFLLGSTVYPKETFPFPVKYEAGHWYASIPETVAKHYFSAEGQ